jgi:four helix bundle protein
MKAKSFEELNVWQDTRVFVKQIYVAFGSLKDWGFKDQICRASLSISNNIVEGFDRKGNKEFLRFLHIARASCSEVRSMLYLALDLGYLTQTLFDTLSEQATLISKRLYAFIRYLQNNPD